MRIIEILITKEEQALKNIGDPSLLLGKFTIEDEELVVSDAIENGSDADQFAKTLDNSEEEFDPFEALMAEAGKTDESNVSQPVSVTDETLFSDINYLSQALGYLNQKESHPVEKLQTVSGVDVKLTPDMLRRLQAVIPEEALPQGETLRLSDDKRFCMQEMKRSMQNNMAETVWPSTQYLWPLHPILNWINDKAGLFFGRGEAPVLGLQSLKEHQAFYVVAGSIPNLKSTPLVDEWFGLFFERDSFQGVLTMNEVLQKTRIRGTNIPNTNSLNEADIKEASDRLNVVVKEAKKYLDSKYKDYQQRMNPLLDEELDKLIELQEKHHEYYQMTLFDQQRRLDEQTRRVDDLFEKFSTWVSETLTIQNNPYIRIIAVMAGVSK